MGQVNVNEPGDPGPREGGYGAGMIIGVILAIIVIVLLVWFLFMQNGITQPANGDPANGDPANGNDEAPPPGNGEDNGDDNGEEDGAWRLVYLG